MNGDCRSACPDPFGWGAWWMSAAAIARRPLVNTGLGSKREGIQGACLATAWCRVGREKAAGSMVKAMGMAWALLAIVGATLVASGVQSIAGMGFGLVAVPVFITLFGPAEGVLWGNVIGSVTAGTLLLEKRKDVDWAIAIRFTVAAVPVIFATVLLTRNLDASMMDVVAGLIMLTLVAFTLFARNMPRAQGRLPMYFTGGMGGFLSASVGQAGPVLTAYARAAQWPQRSFAATLQVYFLAMNAVNIPLKLAVGYGPHDGRLAVATLVAGLVGTGLGTVAARKVSSHITKQQARNFAMIVACVGATLVFARGLVSVLG